MGRKGGSAKILKVKVKSTNDNDVKSLNELFSQVTGQSDPERAVILPKINKLFKNIVEYNKLFTLLLSFKPFTDEFSEYQFWFDDIKKFLENLVKTTEVNLIQKYDDDIEQTYHKLDDKDLCKLYKDLKDNAYLKKVIITGSRLSAYKSHISEVDKMDSVFVQKEPGLTLQPLAFSTLDLKIIWMTAGVKAKKFILSIIRHAYLIGIDCYGIVTSPDVDIKKFSKILITSISKMRQMIPRCDKAFAVIEKSVQMLEDNFSNYFKGSVEAGNPSIIIESFIVDISTTQKSSPIVTAEFQRIVAFLKNRSSQNKDPKIKKLFSMLNNQFASVDTELGVKPVPEEVDTPPEYLEESSSSDSKDPSEKKNKNVSFNV